MNLIKQIKVILRERKIPQTCGAFAMAASDGRTKRLEKLTEDELNRLLETLNCFTPAEIVKYIYIVSFELKIIPNTLPITDNDLLIIRHCSHINKLTTPPRTHISINTK